jgi:hypothetical protein
MDIVLLAVPGCPHAALLERRLAALLAGRPGVRVVRREVRDAGQARRWGMRGSPTLLVDGADPFPSMGTGPAMACRLYWDESGRPGGVPAAAVLASLLAER